MTQCKPDGAHSGGRRKSENRQRRKLVAVRFSPAEHAVLADVMRRTGKSASRVLRETLLMADNHGLISDLLGGTDA